jgi:hypothetical protein
MAFSHTLVAPHNTLLGIQISVPVDYNLATAQHPALIRSCFIHYFTTHGIETLSILFFMITLLFSLVWSRYRIEMPMVQVRRRLLEACVNSIVRRSWNKLVGVAFKLDIYCVGMCIGIQHVFMR